MERLEGIGERKPAGLSGARPALHKGLSFIFTVEQGEKWTEAEFMSEF